MSRPKLLLADDSITIQKVVNLTFADQGMDVVVFSDGDAAIENIDGIKPDIVLADVHMPGINGYQVCELIRSNESTKSTPVVLLVGSFEPFDQDEADRVGANTYLTKPFSSIADVIATVEGLLKKAEAQQQDEVDPEPEVRRPDTRDIDSLYEQSFVETMELPAQGSVEFEADGYDDEMIQTSYAEHDQNSADEESIYPDDLEPAVVEIEDTESLIAESVPREPEPTHDDETEVEYTPADEVETSEAAGERPQPADPFESVAADPPAVEEHAPGPAANDVKFGFDEMDLLELPGTLPGGPVEYTAPGSAGNGREVASLAPELIDLIVQKVIDRLAERGQGNEAKSVSGSEVKEELRLGGPFSDGEVKTGRR